MIRRYCYIKDNYLLIIKGVPTMKRQIIMKQLKGKEKQVFKHLLTLLGSDEAYKLDNAKFVFMPLFIERIWKQKEGEHISLCHYRELNGDAMRNPEMCFFVFNSL